MKTPISTGIKECANCVYWGGDRVINGQLHRIECEFNAKGPCSVNLGWSNVPTNVQCNKFEWHPVLKK